MTVVATPVQRPLAGRGVTEPFWLRAWFCVLVAETLGLAPIEGYLLGLSPVGAKIAPGLLIVSWIGWRLVRRERLNTHLLSALATGLLIIVFASTAVNTENTFALTYVVRWVPFLILTIALIDLLADVVPVRTAVYAMAAGSVAAGIGAIYSLFFEGDRRATGPMEDPNDLAYVLVAAVPLLLVWVARPEAPRWAKALGFTGAVVTLFGLSATISRGGLLALLVLIPWAIWRRLLTRRAIATLSITCLTTGLIAFTLASGLIDRALSEKQYVANSNVDSRATRWAAALRQLADAPFLGVGPGGNRYYYGHYSRFAEVSETTPVTHSMYIEVASELGLIGFLVFLAMFLVSFRAAARSRWVEGRLSLALEGSLVAVLIASTFLSEEYYMPLWATMSALAAHEIRARRRDD